MYISRRQQVLNSLGEASAIVFAATEKLRNNDCDYSYRQDSDFYYLTGFEEPEAVLVLAPMLPEGERVTLFLRERDPKMEVWFGERLGVERAPEALKVDRAFGISKLGEMLPGLLKGSRKLYHTLGDEERDRTVLGAVKAAQRMRRTGAETPDEICDLAGLLHERRLFKTPEEIELMKRAAEVSAFGFERAMAECCPGIFEYQLQAIMEYEWAMRGSRRVAFETIVASGRHACVLHYVGNQDRIKADDLVLVDAGCEFGYYASDISRTWPCGGAFTKPQKEVYEIVLKANKAGIAACKRGFRFDDVHMAAVRVLVEGLISLGICKGTVDEVIASETYKPYYMHRTSHWVGMDVHDVGRYCVDGQSRPLEPGMVLTVEPGLYLSPDAQEIPEQYRGIGVRIEDDVLCTDGEPVVLTASIPKEIADLEALVGSRAKIALA